MATAMPCTGPGCQNHASGPKVTGITGQDGAYLAEFLLSQRVMDMTPCRDRPERPPVRGCFMRGACFMSPAAVCCLAQDLIPFSQRATSSDTGRSPRY